MSTRFSFNFRRLAAVLALAASAGALTLSPALPAEAQQWPARPITVIVPFAPGGTTDIVARPIAQKLSEALGQPVVVENRAGAGGTLGAAVAAKAPADGYTLFTATVAHTMAPGLYKKLAYDFEADFEPITITAFTPNILIVHPSVPAGSLKELIAYIKAHPGKVNYGSAGSGSTEHMSGELFRYMAGVDIAHVPYKGGSPMMTDLISGQIQMAIETSGSAAPFVRAGKVRALAVSSPKRSGAFPDLPTMSEAGLPGYEVTTWYGLLAPRGTPQPVIDRLYAELSKILKSPDMVKRLADIGAEPGGQPPKDFAAFIKDETVKWTKLARASGASID